MALGHIAGHGVDPAMDPAFAIGDLANGKGHRKKETNCERENGAALGADDSDRPGSDGRHSEE
jgi:hypothetical protein